MTNYSRGYHFERRISAHLRSEGFHVVESRGSHGHCDLVAVKVGEVLGVQAKTSGVIGVKEWNEFYGTCTAHGLVPLLACREGLKLRFYELTGLKVKWSRNPPLRPWTADRIAA